MNASGFDTVTRFVDWLARYGEVSYDFETLFAGATGRRAKSLYYAHRLAGLLAVFPLVAIESCLPELRRLFWKKQRFPIGDAHYAMAFSYLYGLTRREEYYLRAVHFLDVLKQTRAPGYKNYCWGYPYDWVTRDGVIPAHTPLITTAPYAYEAFESVYAIDGREEWNEIMYSIAEHAANDIADFTIHEGCCSCAYFPGGSWGGVVNASAYRAALLMKAAHRFRDDRYQGIAAGNLRFVLQYQNGDGSWFYAVNDGRDFIDHFHTCFVLKALAKIEKLTGDANCSFSLEKGIRYYVRELFDEAGLPKPFARPPRLVVYRRELYDYAECINLGTLLKGRFPELDARTQTAIEHVASLWTKPDGSFRTRKLYWGWDNVPMHRWGQSQTFRALCLALFEETQSGC